MVDFITAWLMICICVILSGLAIAVASMVVMVIGELVDRIKNGW